MTSTQGDFAQALAGQAQQQTVSIANQISVASLKHVQNAGTTVDASIRSSLNLIQGTGVTLTIADNAVSDRVDVTVATAVPPGTKLDYKTITSPVAVSATTEGTANTIIAGNSVTYAGSEVKIEYFIPKITASSGAPVVTFVLFYDSTVIGQILGDSTTASTAAFTGCAFHTPSAAAHTYTLKAFVDTGTSNLNAGAGGSGQLVPAFLRVEST